MSKRFYSLIILSLTLITSCDKDVDAKKEIIIDIPIGSIVANIDGVETTFNIESHAILDTIPWVLGETALKLSVLGKNSTSINSKNILIWFFVSPVKQIDEGTYPDLDKQIYHFLEFNNLWQGDLYNYGSNRFVEKFYSSKSTIVRIDSVVQGIFSGNVGIGAGAIGNEQPPLYHVIENGRFNVRLEN